MLEFSIRRVVISANVLFTILRHSLRFGTLQDPGETRGALRGRRVKDTVLVVNAVPIAHGPGSENVGKATSAFLQKLKRLHGKRNGSIVGWYHSFPNHDLSFSPGTKRTHMEVQKMLPGTIALVIDPARMRVGNEAGEYSRIYTMPHELMDSEEKDDSPQIEIRDIVMRTRFDDGLRTILEMVKLQREGQPVIIELQEGAGAGKRQKKAYHPSGTGGGKTRTDLEEIDVLSNNVISLKTQLGGLRTQTQTEDGVRTSDFTKKAKALKLRQLSLFETINGRIKDTTEVQAKIVFYKIRDSLNNDMRLLDEMINDQYIRKLGELIKMESEKSVNAPEDH